MSKYFEKKVEYSEDGATWVDLGHIRSDGTEDGTEAASAETSAGVELYAGTDQPYTIMVTDFSKFAALDTLQKNDTKQGALHLRFTDAEGTTTTEQGFSVIVQKGKQFSTGNRNAFMARFKRFTI